MNILSKFATISGAIAKYGAFAAPAVARVEAEVGPGNGQTKKQLAVAYVLAAAHAGEAVPVPQVQLIATAVELFASLANSLGVFGKPPAPAATVPVPPAEPAAKAA